MLFCSAIQRSGAKQQDYQAPPAPLFSPPLKLAILNALSLSHSLSGFVIALAPAADGDGGATIRWGVKDQIKMADLASL